MFDDNQVTRTVGRTGRNRELEAWLRGLKPGDRVAEVDERGLVPIESLVVAVCDRLDVSRGGTHSGGPEYLAEGCEPPFVLLSSHGCYDTSGRMVPIKDLEREAPYWTLQPLNLRMCVALERRQLIGRLREFDIAMLSTEGLRAMVRVIQEDHGITV